MQWELIVALVIAIPLILFPAAFVWYLNIGGIVAAIKNARERKAKLKEGTLQEQEYENAFIEALERYPWRKPWRES